MNEKLKPIYKNIKHNFLMILLALVYFTLIAFILAEWYFPDSFVNSLYLDTPRFVQDVKNSSEQLRAYGYPITTYALNVRFIFFSVATYIAIGFISTIFFYGFKTKKKSFPVFMLILTGIFLCAITEAFHFISLMKANFLCSIIYFIGYILGLLTGMVVVNYAKFKNTKEQGANVVIH